MANENYVSSDPTLSRFFMSPEEKQSWETGKRIVRDFYARQTKSDALNFFQKRNAREIENLLWAKGSQRMTEFLDYMSIVSSTKAWVNIDMTQQRLAPKMIGVLVQSMAKNRIYPCVSAVDDGSVSEKEERMLDALFRMHEVETIKMMQDASGVQVENPIAFVPDDIVGARVYFELEDKLPKEIKFEEFLASVMRAIDFDRIANYKTLFFLVVLNAAFTKIEKIGKGKYCVDVCIPTNMVYNFFSNDSGKTEVDQWGRFYNLKVRNLREMFGKSKENPNGLGEKEIFNLAKQSSYKNIGTFNYLWNETWASDNFYFNRPYDDCNILIFDTEINCGEDVYYVTKKDNYGKENIQEKSTIPYVQKNKNGELIEQPKGEGTEITKRQRQTWMRGVYAPYSDTMLYWGRPDLIISEYTDTAKPLSSYSANIPFNDGDYVPSLFERALEPLREYTLLKLKRKQLISQLTRTGFNIDIENARNIDLGEGDVIGWEEVVRIKLQTGINVYSSKGINPLMEEKPAISSGVQDDDIQKILGMTETLNSVGSEIRDLLGVPAYRDGSDVGDRTSGKLSENQLAGSYNVTDFIANANMQLWEETFHKLCLLHWNDVVKEEPESKNDMLNTRFEVKVKMKITDYEKELLEADIQRFSQVPDAMGNPLISPKDALMLRDIDNGKLAQWYLDSTLEKNRKKALQEKERLVMANQKVQESSLEQKAKSDQELQDAKLEAEKEMNETANKNKMQEILLEQGLQLYKVILSPAKGGDGVAPTTPAQLPPNLEALLNLAFQNVAISLQVDKNKQQQDVIADQQAQQQASMQQPMIAQQQMQQPQ